MSKKFYLILIICSLGLNAQNNTEPVKLKEKTDFAFSPGLIWQHDMFADVNVVIGKVTVELDGKIPIIGIIGTRIGFESNFRDGTNFTIAPKIGYEISSMVVTMRLSAVNYFQAERSEFRILPEFGFSIGGFVSLCYGYGIPLDDKHLNNLSHHRLSLTFNLNKRLSKGTYKFVGLN